MHPITGIKIPIILTTVNGTNSLDVTNLTILSMYPISASTPSTSVNNDKPTKKFILASTHP